MATDIAALSQLLQASLDPRQNKQGTMLLFISPAVHAAGRDLLACNGMAASTRAASLGLYTGGPAMSRWNARQPQCSDCSAPDPRACLLHRH